MKKDVESVVSYSIDDEVAGSIMSIKVVENKPKFLYILETESPTPTNLKNLNYHYQCKFSEVQITRNQQFPWLSRSLGVKSTTICISTCFSQETPLCRLQ